MCVRACIQACMPVYICVCVCVCVCVCLVFDTRRYITRTIHDKHCKVHATLTALLPLLQSTIYVLYAGLFFIIPCMDSYTKVDLRTVSFDVPPQEVSLSKLLRLRGGEGGAMGEGGEESFETVKTGLKRKLGGGGLGGRERECLLKMFRQEFA